jgi:8-oxo-dGTP pyrophosphatase MutT (NUDIX family)
LPLKVGDDGIVRVLLLTSRETKRWIIPKGWPMKGRKPSGAAAREALEEAGLVGRPSPSSRIGPISDSPVQGNQCLGLKGLHHRPISAR